MLSPGPNSDSLHNPITSWFWWCWNANSFDTGGLVRNLCLHCGLQSHACQICAWPLQCAALACGAHHIPAGDSALGLTVDRHPQIADDWLTIQWPKVNHMMTIGLVPWYMPLNNQRIAGNVATQVGHIESCHLLPSTLHTGCVWLPSLAHQNPAQYAYMTTGRHAHAGTHCQADSKADATADATAHPEADTQTDAKAHTPANT